MEEYMYPFEKLVAYQEARKLVVLCYKVLRHYPAEERFALCDQIRRAVVSVPSNIAEGITKSSYKEKIHFLEIAYGSLMEIYCQFQVSRDLNYIGDDVYKPLKERIFQTARLISGLRKSYMEKA